MEWLWRYKSRSEVITCDTPFHASDHLYQIWKESIQNCRRYRADMIFKVKAKWPWKYRARSKVITCDTPSDANDDLCQIWKECKQNCKFFQGESRQIRKICKKLKFYNFVINPLMVVIICGNYGNNWFRTENFTKRTRFSKSRSNGLEDIGLGQRSSYATHLMLLIFCTKFGKNPSRTVNATDTIFKAKAKWPWRYGSRSTSIICNTHSHTSDHLC